MSRYWEKVPPIHVVAASFVSTEKKPEDKVVPAKPVMSDAKNFQQAKSLMFGQESVKMMDKNAEPIQWFLQQRAKQNEQRSQG